jgi:hypothetical protein
LGERSSAELKAVVPGFAVAEILYAFGLAGDPIAHIQRALPFLS